MDSNPPSDISCKIIGEFEDDAREFTAGEPEYVPVQSPANCGFTARSGEVSQATFHIPSEEALASAKKFWLKIIRRFTEPVPAKKGHVRVRESGEPNLGDIVVMHGAAATEGRGRCCGDELDTSDPLCLAVFRRREVNYAGEGPRLEESSFPIPWTEIVNITFEVRRPVTLGHGT
jgi:hypothetical protein